MPKTPIWLLTPFIAQFDEARQYDFANRLMSIDNQKSGAGIDDQVGKISYQYDKNSNKTSETFSSGPSDLTKWDVAIADYDNEDRFISFTRDNDAPATFATDVTLDRTEATTGAIGNINAINGTVPGGQLSGPRTLNNVHQLSSAGSGSVAQSFNEEGQVTRTHAGHELQWDATGHLEQLDVEGDQAQRYNYGYDCDGRRVWKKKANETKRTVFTYGGPNVITELEISDSDVIQNIQRYVFGTTIDELLHLEKDDGSHFGITRNQQWSVMSVYDWGCPIDC